MIKQTTQTFISITKQHCVNFTKRWLRWPCRDRIWERHVSQSDILWSTVWDVGTGLSSSLIRWLLISRTSTIFHLIIGPAMIFLTSVNGDQTINIWKSWKRVRITICYRIKENITCMITFKLLFFQHIRAMKIAREWLMEFQMWIKWQNILL